MLDANDNLISCTDYVGGMEYTDEELAFIAFEEGRCRPNAQGSFTYEYYDLKDHLGNVRMTIKSSGTSTPEIIQKDSYYPYGMKMAGLSTVSGTENKYTYNGKELIDDFGLNWYHYGARYYDPQLARWHSIDPTDEFHSPYAYCGNSPVMFVDPDGSITQLVGDVNEQYAGFESFLPFDTSLQGDVIQWEAGFFTAQNAMEQYYKDAITDRTKLLLMVSTNKMRNPSIFKGKFLNVWAGAFDGNTFNWSRNIYIGQQFVSLGYLDLAVECKKDTPAKYFSHEFLEGWIGLADRPGQNYRQAYYYCHNKAYNINPSSYISVGTMRGKEDPTGTGWTIWPYSTQLKYADKSYHVLP